MLCISAKKEFVIRQNGIVVTDFLMFCVSVTSNYVKQIQRKTTVMQSFCSEMFLITFRCLDRKSKQMRNYLTGILSLLMLRPSLCLLLLIFINSGHHGNNYLGKHFEPRINNYETHLTLFVYSYMRM